MKANLNSAKESIKLMKQMLARLEANSSRHSVPLMEAASANGQKSMSNSVQRDENSAIDLPGAKAHKILTLSDADVKSIGIDVMMSWYGQADGGGTCAKDFGNELVSRWRAKKTSFCQSFARAGKPLDSSIDCYFVQQTRHHGYGDNLCLMRNVAVNLALFDDESKTLPVIKNYVGTRHFQQPYVHYPKGFVRADCSPSPAYWGKNFFPGWNADWTVDALTSSKDAVECEEWIDHPVLVTQRDTFANFFHDSEDFVNVFLAMAILQWKIGDTQMFLTDLYPKGPFWYV